MECESSIETGQLGLEEKDTHINISQYVYYVNKLPEDKITIPMIFPCSS